MRKKNSYVIPAATGIIVVLAVLIISIINILSDNKPSSDSNISSQENNIPASDLSPTDALQSESEAHGIITAINLDTSTLTLQNLEDGSENDYLFTGATVTRTKYGRTISAALLKPGDFVRIAYNDNNRLSSITGSDTVWTYKNIRNLIIDDSLKKITISDEIYRYDEQLRIISGDAFIGLSDLSTLDIFTVYGVDNYIYLIRVVSGHGWLTLDNAEDFVGGTLYYGRSDSAQITENTKLMLAEGEYEVTAENLSYSGSAVIKISRGKTSVFDLSGYGYTPQPQGTVHFTIVPEGADLYIDGIRTLYNEPVKLTYGEHTIEVELGGYTPYEGKIEVNRSDLTPFINLSAKPSPTPYLEDILYPEDSDIYEDYYTDTENIPSGADGEIPDSTSDDSDDSSELPDSDTEPATPTPVPTLEPSPTEPAKLDENNQGSADNLLTTIKCTDGTSVYIDNVYRGTINGGQLVLRKECGTVVIKLELEGHITKSYTVTIEDDGNDASFTFPDMTPE